jgi:polysaccharide deacetylase family protein (PEP-CTERM system associated)
MRASETSTRRAMSQPLNALTVDLEDWPQLMHKRLTGEIVPTSPLVRDEVEALLVAFAKYRATATFFVLGILARDFPDLIRAVDRAGHEVASHGWDHEPVYRLSPNSFREESHRAKELLEAIVGKPVRGYRAPNFSVGPQCEWALEILQEVGFSYYSSAARAADGAAPAWNDPRHNTLTAVPVSRCHWLGRSFPMGGGYLHILPAHRVSDAVRMAPATKPAIVYLHPYDWPVRPLRLAAKGKAVHRHLTRLRFPHALGRERVQTTINRLLHEFQFRSILGNLVHC